MTARVVCRQDASPEPWSDVELWRLELRRPSARPVFLVAFDDGSASCDRCGRRHPVDQQLAREGRQPRDGMPEGWGLTAAERAQQEPPPADDLWQVPW